MSEVMRLGGGEIPELLVRFFCSKPIRIIPLHFPVTASVEADMDWPWYSEGSLLAGGVFSRSSFLSPCSKGTPEEMPSVVLWTMWVCIQWPKCLPPPRVQRLTEGLASRTALLLGLLLWQHISLLLRLVLVGFVTCSWRHPTWFIVTFS